MYYNSVPKNVRMYIKKGVYVFIYGVVSHTSFQKKWGEGLYCHALLPPWGGCSTVDNVIKIQKNAVSGIFSKTELMRSVELTSQWLIFLMYQEFIFDWTN